MLIFFKFLIFTDNNYYEKYLNNLFGRTSSLIKNKYIKNLNNKFNISVKKESLKKVLTKDVFKKI